MAPEIRSEDFSFLALWVVVDISEFPVPTVNQCHEEGGVTKGGINKCEQTQTNTDKRKQAQRRKRKQTQGNVDKRKQTLTPPFIAVFYNSLCNPLSKHRMFWHSKSQRFRGR